MPHHNKNIQLTEILSTIQSFGNLFPQTAMRIYCPDTAQQQLLSNALVHYQRLSPDERNVVLEEFKTFPGSLNLLVGYIHNSALLLRDSGDDSLIPTALLAASIVKQCGHIDYREYLLVLADLFVTAEEVGVDPHDEFSLAGLTDFHTYAVVRERRRKNATPPDVQ